MEEWKEYKLGDLVTVKGGKRLPKGINLISTKNSHPYIRIRDLGKSKYLQLNSDYEYVDDETQKSISRYITNKGDILLSIVGTIGLTGIVGESLDNANLTENCVKLIDLKNVDRNYLYYFLNSEIGQNEIKKGTVGAVQPKLPIKNIQAISISLPSLPTQQKIAAILSSFDEKIELNNKINENLEQQAHTLFKKWFIDKNDSFPKMTLGKVVSKADGGGDAIKKTPIVEDDTGIKCIRIGDLTNKRSYNDWGFTKVTDKNFKRYKLYKYDIVLARTAVLGLNRLILEDLDAVFNNGMIRLKSNQKIILPLYLYCHMNTKGYRDYMNRIVAETSVRPNMKANYLLSYELIVPNIETQSKFETIAKGIFEQINNLEKENDKLISLRNTLLPKLMNGEIETNSIIIDKEV